MEKEELAQGDITQNDTVQSRDSHSENFIELKIKKPNKQQKKYLIAIGVGLLIFSAGLWIAEGLFDILEHTPIGREIEYRSDVFEHMYPFLD